MIILLAVAVALAAAANHHRYAATSSRRWLHGSLWLALGSLVALAAAVGLTWLNTPDDPATPSRTIVFTTDGVGACGKLQPATDEGTVVVFEKGQKTGTEINASEVAAIGTLSAGSTENFMSDGRGRANLAVTGRPDGTEKSVATLTHPLGSLSFVRRYAKLRPRYGEATGSGSPWKSLTTEFTNPTGCPGSAMSGFGRFGPPSRESLCSRAKSGV